MTAPVVVEPPDAPSQEVVVHERPTLSLVPQTSANELVARLEVIRGAMDRAMQKDIDYGVIPGTGSKPTLLKPGAEKLGALFQLDVQLENEKTWHDDGHLTVVSRATVFHQPTGIRLGSGEGICTTRETKYAYRNESRKCPVCGVAAIIKGKAEYGGGWVCFKKKDGCGAKFRDDDETITGQVTGRVANPDLPDTFNTVDKMASKRARIDAVLAVTGASALFTQDVEEFQPAKDDDVPEPLRGAESAQERLELQNAVQAGIDRLSPTDENWTLTATLAAASTSFKRKVTAIADLTDSELAQILAAMPAETEAA